MKEIMELALSVSEIDTNIREDVRKVMDFWKQQSYCCGKFRSDTSILYIVDVYYLVTGYSELKTINNSNVNADMSFIDWMPLCDLHELLRKLPTMIEEVRIKMKEHLVRIKSIRHLSKQYRHVLEVSERINWE